MTSECFNFQSHLIATELNEEL